MYKFLPNRNNKVQENNESQSLTECKNSDLENLGYIYELLEQTEKITQLVIKEEGKMTLNFNSLLNSEGYTNEQIQKAHLHLESVANSSNITKSLLEQAILNLTLSAEELDNTKAKNNSMTMEMNNIISVFSQFSELLNELLVQYEQIENFATIISEIANQTNLLSLNASIEAARAGEHGRGFSIVAGEIKKLSQSTQDNAERIMMSTKSMTEIINKLNHKTYEGAQIMPTTREFINNSALIMEGITKTEDELLHNLKEVMDSQDNNIFEISQVNSDLRNIINKTEQDNSQFKDLVLSVQKKADYYLNLLHYLNQIDILKEQMPEWTDSFIEK